MPDVWTADDLLFAVVRAAHFESPRQVAAGLQSAADEAGQDSDGNARMMAIWRKQPVWPMRRPQARQPCRAAVTGSSWVAPPGSWIGSEENSRPRRWRELNVPETGSLSSDGRPRTPGPIRQVPEVAGILGSPWPEHTARVESFLAGVALGIAGAAVAPTGSGAYQMVLAHADFAKFVAYLEKTRTDPRRSAVQTAFTRHADAGYAYPARWPPAPRFSCWCGSHKKYRRCCGASASTS